MENKEFCLQNIELLKQLQPIMEKLGIEPDKYFYKDRLVTPGFLTFGSICIIADGNSSSGVMISTDSLIGSWRRDKLEAALPEWCFENGYHTECGRIWWCAPRLNELIVEKEYTSEIYNKVDEICEAFVTYRKSTGQQSLNALAKLIILLDKEGLI